ncbi:MAG TPA: PAS domain S-box protein, partial [Candidatus Brocadiia bacterium]|nr:PAS domain S-box protein [Candidatus Brocadiia bacterium]
LGAAIRGGGMDCGGIYLSAEDNRFELACAQGVSAEFEAGVASYASTSPQVAKVLRGWPVYLPRPDLGAGREGLAEREGVKATAVIPFAYEGRVIGCLILSSRTLDDTPPDARAALETVAAQMGAAVARLNAEERLRRSEERLRLVMDVTSDGFFDNDLATGKVYYSPGWTRMLGYEPEEIESTHEAWASRLHPDDRHGVEELVRDHRDGRTETFRAEFRLRHKDGSWRWILSRGRIVSRDEAGRPLRMVGAHTDITGLKTAEEMLRLGEDRLRAQFKAIPVFATVWRDLQGGLRLVDYNDLAESDTGGRMKDYLGQPVSGLVEPWEDLEADMWRCLRDRVVTEREMRCRLRGKEGERVCQFRCSFAPPDQVVVFSEDISERRQAEAVLRESEARHRLMVENVGASVAIVDEDGVFRFMNAEAAATFGMTPEQAVGKSQWEIFAPAVADRQMARVREVIQTGQRFWTERPTLVRGQERWFDVTLLPLPREDGDRGRCLILARDTTERHAAQESVRESEERFRAIFENTRDAVVWADQRDGTILNCNPAMEEMVERSREELLGQCVTVLHPPQDSQMILALFHGQGPEGATDDPLRVITKSGKIKKVMVSSTVTQVGATPIAQGIFRDVTELRQFEEMLVEMAEQERRNAGYNLHDDLGQHLTGMRLMCEGLMRRLKGTEDGEAVAELARLSEEAIGKVRVLAQGLDPVERRPDGLALALEALARDVERRPYGARVKFETRGAPLVTNHDVASHLYRIAQEAVNNAIRHGRPKQIWVTLSSANGKTELTVENDGASMAEERSEQGSMGIRIMKYRARMIGGLLEIGPRQGGGARIRCLAGVSVCGG